MPGIKYSIDVPSQEIPDEEVNSFYRSGTPEANAAVEKELMKPARDAVMWLNEKGWISDPSKIDDCTQDVVMGMMGRTGSVQNWRSNVGFRRATASMLARRYAAQGWPSQARERSGHMSGGDEQPGALQTATASNRTGGEDQFSRVQGGMQRRGQRFRRVLPQFWTSTPRIWAMTKRDLSMRSTLCLTQRRRFRHCMSWTGFRHSIQRHSRRSERRSIASTDSSIRYWVR